MNQENSFWYSYDGEGDAHRTWMVGATSESDAYQRAYEAGMPKNIELRRLGGGFLGVITIHADSSTLNNERQTCGQLVRMNLGNAATAPMFKCRLPIGHDGEHSART